MGRILSLVLGLIAILAAAHWVLEGTRGGAPASVEDASAPDGAPGLPSAPKQRLDNVRKAAKRLEAEESQRLDEMMNTAR